PHDLGTGTARDHTVAPPEWRLPVPDWPAELPRGDDAAALPPAGGADGAAEAARSARPLSAPDGGPAPAPDPTDLRHRLHRLGRLRPPGTSADRLQPDQAGPPVVPSVALLRGGEIGRASGRGGGWRRG